MKCLAALLSALLALTACVPVPQSTPAPTPSPTESEEISVMDKIDQLMAMRDLDEIFALENDTDFAIALSSALADWTNYGEDLDVLSPEAQVFYLCYMLEMQVNNDGFVGFMFESYGQWAQETLDALETIGAPKTADILRRAIAALPDGICPKDYVERNNIFFADEDKYYEYYDTLDNEFYDNPDGDLQDFYVPYAREHRDCFSAPGG